MSGRPPRFQTQGMIEERFFGMIAFFSRVGRFIESEDGPAAVEYAVMLALILVACMNIVALVGHNISGTFKTVNSALPASS